MRWIFYILMFVSVSYGGEADYFTNRYRISNESALSAKPNKLIDMYTPNIVKQINPGLVVRSMEDLPDALVGMNQKMNQELDHAAAKVEGCNPKDLQRSILDSMGGFLVAEIEKWFRQPPTLPAYSPFNYFNKYGTVYSDVNVLGCCAAVMKINGSLVSMDKLGHFLAHGYEYFEIFERQGSEFSDLIGSRMNKSSIPFSIGLKGEAGALEFGHRQEAGAWGLRSSGVYSYGDITANYDGFRFWKELTKRPTPYFSCRNGSWKRVRHFNWADYVSDGWDEGLNCNSYVSKDIEDGVAARIKQIQVASGKSVTTCPVEPTKCQGLIRRYSEVQNQVLSPRCIDAAKQKTQSGSSVKTTLKNEGVR